MQRTLTGEVIHGNKIGTQLGFPTANLALDDEAPYTNGVYAVRITVAGSSYDGVANIGSRPTVTDEKKRLLEVYLFHFEGDLYGQTLQVELISRLRPEQKFASLEELKAQIERDKTEAAHFLKNHPAPQ